MAWNGYIQEVVKADGTAICIHYKPPLFSERIKCLTVNYADPPVRTIENIEACVISLTF